MKNNFLIIVPTLNSHKQLPKLINSLNKQDYTNWRVIFIDGKSSPEHKRYLSELCEKHEKFAFVNQVKNSGIYNAMNMGFRLANKDDWILFWGSDDYAYSKNTFKRINNSINFYLSKEIEPNLIIFNGAYVTNKFKFLKHSFFLSREKEYILKKNLFRRKLFLGYVPPHQASLIRSKNILDILFYSENYSLASDLDLFLKISRKKSLTVINSPLPIVKMINEGVSSRKHFLRTKEVILSYFASFGILFFFPFFMRYLKRIYRILL